MKFLLTLRMDDGSKKEVEETGKMLTDVFEAAFKVKGAKEIIKCERVGEIGEYANVKRDGEELYDYENDRRWVKPKVPKASLVEEHHDPNDWYVEVDKLGKPLPGYWIYCPQDYPPDGSWGVVVCYIG
jgi:hypothetical protein